MEWLVNSLRPKQNGRRFADDIFKWIFMNENVRILIKISLKFVPKGPINSNPALVQIMAWRHPGDKPLSEPMMVSLPTHICIARPQWVNSLGPEYYRENTRYICISCHFTTARARVVEMIRYGWQWLTCFTVITISADVLETQGARASTPMEFTYFSWNILVSAPDESTYWDLNMMAAF